MDLGCKDRPEGKEIYELTTRLVALLSTDEQELTQRYRRNVANWQCDTARKICEELLEASRADGLGGCWLCQS